MIKNQPKDKEQQRCDFQGEHGQQNWLNKKPTFERLEVIYEQTTWSNRRNTYKYDEWMYGLSGFGDLAAPNSQKRVVLELKSAWVVLSQFPETEKHLDFFFTHSQLKKMWGTCKKALTDFVVYWLLPTSKVVRPVSKNKLKHHILRISGHKDNYGIYTGCFPTFSKASSIRTIDLIGEHLPITSRTCSPASEDATRRRKWGACNCKRWQLWGVSFIDGSRWTWIRSVAQKKYVTLVRNKTSGPVDDLDITYTQNIPHSTLPKQWDDHLFSLKYFKKVPQGLKAATYDSEILVRKWWTCETWLWIWYITQLITIIKFAKIY